MHHKSVWRSTFVQWLPLAIAILVLSGLVYAAVQQDYRQNANDPQIQIAQDVATAIKQGTPANTIVPPNPTTDIASSLSPFAAIYDDTGKPVGSSVSVNGKLPTLPSGVFEYAKKHGRDMFTWQPQKGLRVAAVLVPYSGSESGFVLAGRSMTEIEKRINFLLMMCVAAAVAALALSFLAIYFLSGVSGYSHKHEHESAESEKGTPASHHQHHQS